MLQQTQVTTVIPYYRRFMLRFPTATALAAATQDELLDCWTGLGYYARARNLHRAARRVVDELGGRFPDQFDQVLDLPGIGRSTAGAILAFAFGQRHAILDGNVKRVLARCFAVAGYPGDTAVARKLWALSECCTPQQEAASYTQAIMDLGSMVCTRRNPQCGGCPLASRCQALARQDIDRYPGPRPKRKRPLRHVTMILVRNTDGCVLLERRPAVGIWGGLWSFPECPAEEAAAAFCQRYLGVAVTVDQPWPSLHHGFTHFELNIQPQPVRYTGKDDKVLRGTERIWYKPGSAPARGLAAPVRKLLSTLETN
jgi:A/G-specific adenine glycosylase